MRRLHAVGKQEIFVASGVYEFEQNDTKIGLTESWSIHEVGGAQFIRVDVDGRDHDGRSILYEVLRSPDGQIERVDLRAYGNAQDAVKQAKANCIFFDDRVEIICIVNNTLRFEQDVNMPPGYNVHLETRLFAGFLFSRISNGQFNGFTINFDFSDPSIFLKGHQESVEWEQIKNGWVQIELGSKAYEAQIYEGVYGRSWHDQFEILLREETPTLIVTLKQYARRPERQTHD